MPGPQAKIDSVSAVDRLRAALQEFADEASAALAALEMETNRALQWVEVDRKDYWNHQLRQSWDRVSEAKVDLERKQIFTVAGREPPCREEKLALEKARRRQALAEEKVRAVKHWSQVVDHEVLEFRGIVNQLADFVMVDLPKGVAALVRMRTALENYLHVEAPIDLVAMFPPGSAATTTAAPSAGLAAVGRPPEEQGPPPESFTDPAELAQTLAELEADARETQPPAEHRP